MTEAEERKPELVENDSCAQCEDGVDLTVIRWMLSMTPAERLDVLQKHVSGIVRLRDGAKNP